MTRLLTAEALKLRTTRAPAGLAALALALGVGITAAVAGSLPADTADPLATAASPGGIALTVSILLGVLVVATEFRHDTITASLLVTPDRPRLLLAKLGVVILAGLGLGLLVGGLAAGVAATLLESRGIATGADAGTYARMVLGTGLASALAAAIGVGVGALVRNQVGAAVGVLVWLYVVEQLLIVVPGVGDAVGRFGIVGVSSAATSLSAPDPTTELLGQGPALAVLAGWAVVLAATGGAMLSRRDVG